MVHGGTIAVVDKTKPVKVMCPYRCSEQKTVDTKTGICEKCKRVFTIHSS